MFFSQAFLYLPGSRNDGFFNLILQDAVHVGLRSSERGQGLLFTQFVFFFVLLLGVLCSLHLKFLD